MRGGREEKTIEKIKSELEKKGWSGYFREFKVVSDSQKKNILRGYILCYCHLTSELARFFYQVPEVIALPILQGSTPYLHWLAQESS